MKNTALCIALLLSAPSLVADDLSREVSNCRDLVASVRPQLSDENEGSQFLAKADKAYRDCRASKFPVEIRAKALFKYGIATAARERQQASIAALREAIELLDQPKDNTSLLVEILDYTAFVESRAGLQNDATAHAKRAFDLRAKTYGSTSAQAAEGLVHLAMVHVTFHEYAKTEALLRDAIRIAQKACGPECDALVNAYAGMQTLYEAQGMTAEAKKYAELGLNAVPARKD